MDAKKEILLMFSRLILEVKRLKDQHQRTIEEDNEMKDLSQILCIENNLKNKRLIFKVSITRCPSDRKARTRAENHGLSD
jgi:hypothetical protein